MIDITKHEIGTIFYKVEEENNYMRQKRLKFMDEHGNEWYRYDMQRTTYTVRPVEYIGRLEINIIGVVPQDYRGEFDTQYHFNIGKDKDWFRADDTEFWDNCFTTEQEANEVAAKFAAERKVIEDESSSHYTVSVVAPKPHSSSV